MDIDVKAIVDKASEGKCLNEFKKKLSNELYPDAFADEYSWLRVKGALEAHDEYVRSYLIEALKEILNQSNA